MRIRLKELFQDYDKLRSGLMTSSQFRRCVVASMDKGVVSPLTEAEIDILIDNYRVPRTDMVRWRAFVESIDKGNLQIWPFCLFSSGANNDRHIISISVFGARKLESSPTSSDAEVVKPFRRPLSPTSELMLQEVIERLRSYVKHHGSDVKSWFKDFDKYNNGTFNS